MNIMKTDYVRCEVINAQYAVNMFGMQRAQ